LAGALDTKTSASTAMSAGRRRRIFGRPLGEVYWQLRIAT
jgi:hypothetical protein